MSKIKYISVIKWYSIIIWVIFLILTINIQEINNFEVNLRDYGRIIQGIIFVIVAFVCFLMLILLYQLNKSRQKDIIVQLIGYFSLSAIGLLLQGIFEIIEFQVRDFQTFFTDSSLIFLVGAGFCSGFFVIDVFKKGIDEGNNSKRLDLFLLATMVGDFGLLLMKIIEIPIYILIIPLGGFIVFFLFYFFNLIYGAFDLRKRMETPIEKQAFLLIGSHGIILILVALFAIMYSFTDIFEFRYISAALTAVAFYSLYRGITLPMKKEA